MDVLNKIEWTIQGNWMQSMARFLKQEVIGSKSPNKGRLDIVFYARNIIISYTTGREYRREHNRYLTS